MRRKLEIYYRKETLTSTCATTNSPPGVLLINIDQFIYKIIVGKISFREMHSFGEDAG